MNSELVHYIESKILPQYETFTDGHDRRHIETTIKESLYLAKKWNADENIVYTIAAYHDLGIPKGRDDHHITSAVLLSEDQQLLQWFTSEEIKLMKEVVEDHRASAEETPRSLYGCIIADADHFVIPEEVLHRTILYCKTNFPAFSSDQLIEHTYNYLNRKYCEEGYLQFHLDDERSLEGLAALRELLKDKKRFQTICRSFL